MFIKIIIAFLAGFLTFITSKENNLIFALIVLLVFLALFLIEKWKKPFSYFSVFIGLLGMGAGIFISHLILDLLEDYNSSFALLKQSPFTLFLFLGILGFYLGFKGVEYKKAPFLVESEKQEKNPLLAQMKILDTSAIIDSRIIDICETGFIEGIIVIPQFILKELQHVADSLDSGKRSRGRKGLSELNRLKQSKKITVKILEQDYLHLKEVDHKLIQLAKDHNGCLVTTDYNLNKIATLEGIKVLNVNELGNTLKPAVMTNEELQITVLKEGKDPSQGVGYLDDGTMVVVDGGIQFLGKEIFVVVTSVLQTAAGRMIFTQPKYGNKA